ncbi:MAG: hypothetical protein HY902_20445 [Deltaproteobacteria bacterium]|nr:hypothetical protein [Deltaproteobacteria bacterium]
MAQDSAHTDFAVAVAVCGGAAPAWRTLVPSPLGVLTLLMVGLIAGGCSGNSGTAGQTANQSGFNIPNGTGTVANKDATSGGNKDTATAKPDATTTGADAGQPADDTVQPQDDAQQPQDDAEPPPEDGEQPQDDSEQPADDAEQPQEDAEQPQEDTQQPQGDAVTCDVDEDQDGACFCDGYDPSSPIEGCDCDDNNPNFSGTCPDCSVPGTPGCSCKFGVKPISCYGGEPGWVGKGACLSGQHVCQGGYWQPCAGEVFPDPEKCDGKDNDCDGETDEGVKSTCGTCDLTCNEQKIGGGGPMSWNLNSENSTGLGLTPNGDVTLDASQISLNLKFIWIANSPNNTVSKVDCKTVTEVGRFSVCPDPSRTSVDLEGNVWVACRGNGAVAKIIAEKKNCIDKNGNGVIETSTGNQPIGNDECVKFIAQPNKGSYARAAGVDKENHVWIGYWNSMSLVRLHKDTGATMEDIALGCSPYGLVIDQQGIIWLQGAGCGGLIRVDPATKVVTKKEQLPALAYPSGAYGINVDNKGRIWVASGNSASCFDPKTLQWKVVSMQWGGGRGIATANDGFVYPAVDGSGGAVKINGNVDPPQVVGFMKGAGGPVGAALDYDGFVWVVNQSGSSATKLDPKTMAAVGTVPVGSSPYTYSDMTGYTLNYFTAPKGQFTTVFFGGIGSNPITTNSPKQVWQSLSAEADLPAGTNLRIRLRAANTSLDLEAAKWSAPVDFPPETFPYDLSAAGIIGNLLQVEVQLLTKEKKLTPVLKSLSAKSKLM